MTKLRDLLRPAITIEEHEPLSRAAQRMYDERVGAMCVVDPDGTLRGIFTERDLLRACAAGVDTHSATVSKWMTEGPRVADANDEAGAALQVMIDHDFRHLPVYGDGGLLGMVSMRRLTAEMHRQRMG